eukprot:TRINITY_DN24738_c0_g1_i1.p1 TRINITY_DN24738_c0_g1~~TRINITY_DN24738_c0_g1_i1.p1  ORF type:complete len:115 (-),score=22.06 TRINITY_DN24738_c0_g1_i1:19-363(-)
MWYATGKFHDGLDPGFWQDYRWAFGSKQERILGNSENENGSESEISSEEDQRVGETSGDASTMIVGCLSAEVSIREPDVAEAETYITRLDLDLNINEYSFRAVSKSHIPISHGV